MSVSFPTLSTLPSSTSWSESLAYDPTIKSQRESGKVKRRARFTTIPRKCSINYVNITSDDKNKLQYFERVTVKVGAVTFPWQNAAEAYDGDAWQANHAYVIGDVVRPTTATGRSYVCIVAGTSHNSTQPTWPASDGYTVTDGVTLLWKENTYTMALDKPIEFSKAESVGYWNAALELSEA